MKTRAALPSALIVLTLALALACTVMLVFASGARAAGEAGARALAFDPGWAFAAAAFATAASSLGAGFAVARVGTAAVGALAEKPELFGRLLIFIGLAEGIAIYGLIVAILMLNKLG